MKKIVKLTESDLTRIIKKVISEQTSTTTNTTINPTKIGGAHECPGGQRCGKGCCRPEESCGPTTGLCFINATRK
jgi:hypothetical protein